MRKMTQGSIARHLIAYALPLILGNLFQLTYNAVDSIVIGKFAGENALAAVSAANPVMTIMILGVSGVSIGASVLMSRFYGAGDEDALRRANSERFARIYPDRGANRGTVMESTPAPRTFVYGGEAVEHPVAYLPVFPGTNCDYDTARAFRRAGAEVETTVFCNLSAEAIFRSIREMKEHIRRCHIFVLSGGFSSGDEPDGSGKFIANVLNNKDIAEEIHALLDRGGLILGICNGFQALVKSGLLPYGRLGCVTKDSPTLFRNDINRHVSQIVTTRVASTASPWLSSFSVGDLHSIAVSHGEGKFVVGEQLARRLFERGQVAFQYAGPDGHATAEAPCNPNGSFYAIEGIVSEDGRILGKMGHTERYGENLFKNICGEKRQPIFENAVAYFRKRN